MQLQEVLWVSLKRRSICDILTPTGHKRSISSGAHIHPNYLTIITREILKPNPKFLLTNQVLWLGKPELEVTWESAASLPPTIIEEFEEGVQP